MKTAAKLREEAQYLRAFALTVTDPSELAEIEWMIAELERRSRELGNGDGGVDVGDQRFDRTRQPLNALQALSCSHVTGNRPWAASDSIGRSLVSYHHAMEARPPKH